MIPDWVHVIIVFENGQQFVNKAFTSWCNNLGVVEAGTTMYLIHTIGQVERYNKMLVSVRWHYVADNQCNWDIFGHPLSYFYDYHSYRSTNVPPFSLRLTQYPRDLMTASIPIVVPMNFLPMIMPKPTREHPLNQLTIIWPEVSGKLRRNSRLYKPYPDRKHWAMT